MGNSVYGSNPWVGEIYGLALYDHVLSTEEVAENYHRWQSSNSLKYARQGKPTLLYLFDKIDAGKIYDYSGNKNNFELPDRVTILKRRILLSHLGLSVYSIIFTEDTVINIVGFLPFGFFLYIILLKLNATKKILKFILVILIGFLLSFSIEIYQSLLPSRHSTILDLELNTFGTMFGALICFLYLTRISKNRSLKYSDDAKNPNIE